MNLSPGVTLQNRYRIVARLGQGGMGAVYRAWDTRLNVAVALKEMVPQPGLDAQTLAQMRAQFGQEATVLARLNHPHLVNVTDFFEEEGKVYLVMRFIEGESLASRIAREGPIPEAQVVVWAQQLLDALDYCHSQGVLHRDIKPQNIIIRADGQAVFVDFGLVKLWNPDDPYTRTVMRGMGTPEYAPPEQYGTRSQHTDPRSDIYSLGATLYHALTGHLPPSATDRMARPEYFVPPSRLTEGVSPAVEAAILKAMALTIDQRFAGAREMSAALTVRRMSGPAIPVPAASAPTPRLSGPRAWLWAAGGATLLLLGSGVLLVARPFSGGAAPPITEPPRATLAVSSDGAGRTPTVSATLLPSPVPLRTRTPAVPPTENTPTATLVVVVPPSATSPPPYPSATPTPVPTVSSPTPTPTLVATTSYEAIPLGSVANATQGFVSPPTGDVTLGGVPFSLTERVFQSQAVPPPHDTYPTRAHLDTNLAGAQRVHLLITTGNGFNEYLNRKVGEVWATCNGYDYVLSDLALGQEVREWHGEPNVVSTMTRSREVWVGEIAGAGVQGHIDLLSLDLPEPCRSGTLQGIDLVDTSVQTIGSLDPAFNLTGVTVEVNR